MPSQLRSMLMIAALVPACGLFGEPTQNDGEVCSVADDCSTGVCTTANLCSHSRCECPSGNCQTGGEPTSDCLDGWVCVSYESIFDPVEEFFGGTPNPSDGFCQPTCAAGCPEHYLCDGDFCEPDASWVAPEPTVAWSGAVSGELVGREQMTTVRVEGGATLSLTGSATSPAGATIVSSSWTTVSAAGDYLEFDGATLETTVPTDAGNFRRVEFIATDDRARSSMITVIFEACTGAGETCTNAGAGCCNGCDDGSNICQ